MHLEVLIMDTYEVLRMGVFTIVLGQVITVKIDL